MGWMDDAQKYANPGAVIGGIAGGPAGAAAGSAYGAQSKGHGVLGDLASGNWSGLGEDLGFSNKKGQQAQADYAQSLQQQFGETQGVLGQMKTADDAYLGQVQTAGKDYLSDVNKLKDQASQQANDASTTYTNTILPRFQDIMERSGQNAKSAMSLSDAMDPNNKVQTAYRNMFNQQATGVQNQGLASYGTMAALGAQATGTVMGGSGMPMTGGQMAALQGANLGQAGAAMMRAQQQAQDLRQQGIMTGINQSGQAYQWGQQAQQQAAADVGNYQGAYNQGQNIQNYYRGQQGQYAQDVLGTNMGMYNTQQGLAQTEAQNQLAAIGQKYGAQQGMDQAAIQQANAAQAAKLGALGTLGGAAIGYGMGGGGAAGMQGAGVGAGIGGSLAGAAAAQGATPVPYGPPPPQYQSYAGTNPYAQRYGS